MKSSHAEWTCDRCGELDKTSETHRPPQGWTTLKRRVKYSEEEVAHLCAPCGTATIDFVESGTPTKASPRVEQAPAGLGGPFRSPGR